MKSKLCPRDGELHYRYEAGAKFSEQKHPTLLSLSGVFSSQVIIWRGDITTLSHQQPTRGDPGGRNYHNTYNAIFQDIKLIIKYCLHNAICDVLENLCNLYFPAEKCCIWLTINWYIDVLDVRYFLDLFETWNFFLTKPQCNLAWFDPLYLSIKVELFL